MHRAQERRHIFRRYPIVLVAEPRDRRIGRQFDSIRGLIVAHIALHTELGAGGSDDAATASDDDAADNHLPAVSVRKSLASKDHIISMIDGKPYKTLRRHLSTHGLTPEEYRQRYNLKPDYPMVAPTYSEQRRAMAKKIGLGQKGRAAKGGRKTKSA